MFKIADLENAPGQAPRDGIARLRIALTERRPAAALELLDVVESGLSEADSRAIRQAIWAQAGSLRALAALDESDGELSPLGAHAVTVTPVGLDAALETGAFAEVDLPRLDPDALVLVRDAAAHAGRAADLARAQLALAETAERVDLRVGLVEAAQALAHALGDRVLTALVEVFLARLDADFGEAEDAVERVAEVLSLVTPEEAPIATTLALMVRAAVLKRAAVPTPSGTSPEADKTAHPLDARLPDLIVRVGWQAGYPGPAWGLRMPTASLKQADG